MKSPSSLLSAEDNLSHITEHPLSLAEAVLAVECNLHGAVATFSGTVRNTEAGEPISAIHYEVYTPMANSEFKKIIEETRKRWPVRCFVRHRVGRVPVGDTSVVVACGSPHRKEAFEACEFIIEQIKKNVPIWKILYEK